MSALPRTCSYKLRRTHGVRDAERSPGPTRTSRAGAFGHPVHIACHARGGRQVATHETGGPCVPRDLQSLRNAKDLVWTGGFARGMLKAAPGSRSGHGGAGRAEEGAASRCRGRKSRWGGPRSARPQRCVSGSAESHVVDPSRATIA